VSDALNRLFEIYARLLEESTQCSTIAAVKYIRMIAYAVLACLVTIRMAGATDVMKSVALPSAEGMIVGAAFSPDSSRVAVMRNVAVPAASGQRHVMQIVELRSGKELAHADVLDTEAASLAFSRHFIAYSTDCHFLLLATKGSDVISILDAASLRTMKQIALHPATGSRKSLGEGHLYFKGIVSLAVSSKGGFFGALTHDELQDNEVFIGSFDSEQIIKSWSLGQGRMATELGQISLSLSQDGSKTAVSVLPKENSLPKSFNNLRLYDSGSGRMVKSIRTNGLVGQIVLVPGESILASRIDTPGVFTKKTCIEKWDFGAGTLDSQFCDQGRIVGVTLAASLASDRVVGFASHLHKSIEGQVYAASGRVNVWDVKTGSLIASSGEVPHFISFLQISPNGEWVMADQLLLQLAHTPYS
jgi:WD40 repeat protein